MGDLSPRGMTSLWLRGRISTVSGCLHLRNHPHAKRSPRKEPSEGSLLTSEKEGCTGSMITWLRRLWYGLFGCPTCGNDITFHKVASPYDYWQRSAWVCSN